jgi:hypothetical protein
MKNCNKENCPQSNPQSMDSFYKGRNACKKCYGLKRRGQYTGNPQLKWQKSNPDKCKGYQLKRYWLGLSGDEALAKYNEMLSNQRGVCLICQRPERNFDKRTGKLKSLAVDHDHKTGQVRGLLCETCNKAFGLLEENIYILRRMRNYKIKNTPA